LPGNGFGDLKNFRRKALPGKPFGHLMIFLTIALKECQVEASSYFDLSVY
jgi:hypothetical protein